MSGTDNATADMLIRNKLMLRFYAAGARHPASAITFVLLLHAAPSTGTARGNSATLAGRYAE
jgi:hypothetical protein